MPADPDLSRLFGRLRLRHLEVFQAVCERHTLRKAAEACHLTQPAATRLILELEAMLGVPLFERDRRGMRLTAYGQRVRRHADLLRADLGQMRTDIDRYRTGITGRIRLGVIPSLASELLGEAIARTLSGRRDVQFLLREGTATDLIAALRRNELDLTFGRIVDERASADRTVLPIYSGRFAIACRRDHPLAAQCRVDWTTLARQAWVLPPGGSPLRAMVEQLFQANRVLRPFVAVESSSFHHTRELLSRSDLLGLLPQALVARAADRQSLNLLKRDIQEAFTPICMILRNDVEPEPLVTAFIEQVRLQAGVLGLEALPAPSRSRRKTPTSPGPAAR